MITHSQSRRTAKALPQVESTILVEHTDAPIIKCKARQSFKLGNATVQTNATFFLVKSSRRDSRYYAIVFNEIRGAYQCSCGCNMCEHEHLKVTREYVMAKVVKPAKPEAAAMTVPATVAEVRNARKAKVTEPIETPKKAIDWAAVAKADRARQRAWQAEYQAKLAEARAKDKASA